MFFKLFFFPAVDVVAVTMMDSGLIASQAYSQVPPSNTVSKDKYEMNKLNASYRGAHVIVPRLIVQPAYSFKVRLVPTQMLIFFRLQNSHDCSIFEHLLRYFWDKI